MLRHAGLNPGCCVIQKIVQLINNRQNDHYFSATHTLHTFIRNSAVTTFIPGGRTTYYTGLTYQDKSERLSSESLILRGTVIFSTTKHRCVELVLMIQYPHYLKLSVPLKPSLRHKSLNNSLLSPPQYRYSSHPQQEVFWCLTRVPLVLRILDQNK